MRTWSSIWSAYRYRAKDRGYKWELTQKEFYAILRKDCYYCGASPRQANGNKITIKNVTYYYSGVDRLNNEPIYSKKTVVPCCAMCNKMKNVFKKRSFLGQIKKIYLNCTAIDISRQISSKGYVLKKVSRKRRRIQSRNKSA